MREIEFSRIKVGVWKYDDEIIKDLLEELFSSKVVVFDGDNDIDCDSAVIVASEKVSSILGADKVDIIIDLKKVKMVLEERRHELMNFLGELVCLRHIEKEEVIRIKRFL